MPARLLPMFPLGSVVFPSQVLPLHVFETRYRTLMQDLRTADEPVFGVVLIERGSEVGGGDQRADLGTLVRIQQARELEDGRWAVVCSGVGRIRVEEWLADDPYPRAMVTEIEEINARPGAAGLREKVEARLHEVRGLAAELADAEPPQIQFHPDTELAVFQMAAAAPLGPLDAQAVLEADTPEERLRVLDDRLVAAGDVLRFRLGRDEA